MFIVKVGSNTYKFREESTFNMAYFALARDKKNATGHEGGKLVFALEKGVEKDAAKAQLFAARPDEWRKPTAMELAGILAQFRNLSALARLMGISRTTITLWQKTGPVAGITFLSWRYLCEYIGVHTQVIHNLEYSDVPWLHKLPEA